MEQGRGWGWQGCSCTVATHLCLPHILVATLLRVLLGEQRVTDGEAPAVLMQDDAPCAVLGAEGQLAIFQQLHQALGQRVVHTAWPPQV